MTVYNVIHHYELDEGYVHAVPEQETIATFSSYLVAKRFVERYNNPHVYERKYDDMKCGLLEIKEQQILDDFDENDEKWKTVESTLNYVLEEENNDY